MQLVQRRSAERLERPQRLVHQLRETGLEKLFPPHPVLLCQQSCGRENWAPWLLGRTFTCCVVTLYVSLAAALSRDARWGACDRCSEAILSFSITVRDLARASGYRSHIAVDP